MNVVPVNRAISPETGMFSLLNENAHENAGKF